MPESFDESLVKCFEALYPPPLENLFGVPAITTRKAGHSREPGNSRLARYVCGRLPDDYMVKHDDLLWLDECDSFVKGELANASVTSATKAALAANPNGHIDPFELLIDAGICDPVCEPVG